MSTMSARHDGMSKVRALLDVLPLLRRYEGRTIVIKYGGSALDAASTDTILEDAAALQSVGVRVILVHGGGQGDLRPAGAAAGGDPF